MDENSVIIWGIGGFVLTCLVVLFIVKGGLSALWRNWLAMKVLIRHQYYTKKMVTEDFGDSQSEQWGDFRFDRYPSTKQHYGTIIMLYGLTVEGELDSRLVTFATSFARSGFQVIVPYLEGLKEFQFQEKDLNCIEELIRHFSAEEKGNLHVMAFSFGGGYALRLAGKPAIADCIDTMVIFGAYYSLDQLLSEMNSSINKKPKTEDDWNDYIWLLLVLQQREKESLKVSKETLSKSKEFLSLYSSTISFAEKMRLYREILYPIELTLLQRKFSMDPETSQSLSPSGNLESVKARVNLIHDSRDSLVSPDHARKIFDELSRREKQYTQKLLITPLISHVNARSPKYLVDFFRLTGLLGDLFRKT